VSGDHRVGDLAETVNRPRGQGEIARVEVPLPRLTAMIYKTEDEMGAPD